MTALQSEQADIDRVSKAREYVAHCRDKEAEARKALADAIGATQRAKEKCEALFAECEQRAVARRKSGQIVNNPGY